MKRISQIRLTGLLSAALIGLSYSLFASSDPKQDTGSPLQVAKPSGEAISLPAKPQLPPLTDFSETLKRPLFQATRRPPPVSDVPEESFPVERNSYQLVGVTLFDKRRVALIRSSGDSRLIRLSEGQRLDRWRVLRIEARRIVIARGGERLELHLNDER